MSEQADDEAHPERDGAFGGRVRVAVDRSAAVHQSAPLAVQLVAQLRVDGDDGQLRLQVAIHRTVACFFFKQTTLFSLFTVYCLHLAAY